MDYNSYWYGVKPYNKKDLEDSIKRWSYLEETKEEFVQNLTNDALWIGMVDEDNCDWLPKWLGSISDELLYAVADFINDLLNK